MLLRLSSVEEFHVGFWAIGLVLLGGLWACGCDYQTSSTSGPGNGSRTNPPIDWDLYSDSGDDDNHGGQPDVGLTDSGQGPDQEDAALETDGGSDLDASHLDTGTQPDVGTDPDPPDPPEPLGIVSIDPDRPGPQSVGEAVRWTVSAVGPQPLEVAFFVFLGAEAIYSRDFGEEDFLVFSAHNAGTYHLIAHIKSPDGRTASDSSELYRFDGTLDGTPILGVDRVSVERAQNWAQSQGAHERFIAIAPAYWLYAKLTGIRPEVLYVQAAHETGFGRYGGAVHPDQNNWAGIKIRNPTGDEPEDHESFATPQEGVRAHFNHVCAYLGLDPVGEPHDRYYVVLTLPWAGSIRYVEEFGERWAPNPAYGSNIVNFLLHSLIGA